MNIGIFTIAYNGYGRFIPQWCRAISELTRKPAQVTIALFGEEHGLTDERIVECKKILSGIPTKIIHRGKHINMGTDRNKAIEKTPTEWIMPVSADDLILPIAIEEFEKYASPDVDVIACSYIERGINGNEQIWRAPRTFSKKVMLNWRGYWLSPYSPFRHSLWEQHPYIDGEYPNIPFVFALAGARFARSDVPCVRYIRRKDSHFGGRAREEQRAIEKELDQCARATGQVMGKCQN